ncbi:MAG TPA: NAD(P)-dependent oxidoreductase [Candidatus Bathyarchaeia archaeon]|nr:NAD(P)-dependent oxidoreductase [Candidatus Bathyarchaeia archaeon]
MLVDLNLRHKSIIIMGEDQALESRTRQLLEAKAKVTVVGEKFSRTLRQLSRSKHFELVSCNPLTSWKQLSKKYKPYAVILATTNRPFVSKVASLLRADCKPLLYAADMPDMNDFNMPAISKLGDVRVAISTGGISPAMIRILRKRIERTITLEDIREVQLQRVMRAKIRSQILDPKLRRICIYKIIRNKKIKESLRKGDFEDAMKLATKQVERITQRSLNM